MIQNSSKTTKTVVLFVVLGRTCIFFGNGFSIEAKYVCVCVCARVGVGVCGCALRVRAWVFNFYGSVKPYWICFYDGMLSQWRKWKIGVGKIVTFLVIQQGAEGSCKYESIKKDSGCWRMRQYRNLFSYD